VIGLRRSLVVGALAALSVAAPAAADDYALSFIPTQNAPAGATATMRIHVADGRSTVSLRGTHLFPNTVYTIWTVFNVLKYPDEPFPLATESQEVPSTPAASRPGFPREGNGVAPVARLDAGFTGGMGLDPGSTFITDGDGNGGVTVRLDYDIVREAPVANKDVIVQCAPVPGTKIDPATLKTVCADPGSQMVKVTTTWLRTYIGQYPESSCPDAACPWAVKQAERGANCANYAPEFDRDNPAYDAVAAHGMDARLWQCVDPSRVSSTSGIGLPRVPRYVFDHFRLANHPDDLTHGFIGGNTTADHWIDMVGRYADLVSVPAADE
jgi:hypothetical protein